jgi:hypothetical protein
VKIKWKPFDAFSRQALAFAFCFAILFGVIALIEHRFAVWQISDSEAADLEQTVGDVSGNLFRHGHWNLASFMQWPNTTPSSYLVLAGTGQLIDASGDPTDFIRSALPVDKYISRRPAFIRTDVGERWLIQNRRVDGGNVVGGIVADDLVGLRDPEVLLAKELIRYGTTVKSASDLDPAAVRNFVTSVMVITDSGEITNNYGGVPLRVQVQLPDQLLDGRIHNLQKGDHNYTLLSRRISTDAPSALIIAFDDMSTQAIDESLRFNLWLAAGAWLLALFGFIAFAIRNKLKQSRLANLHEISTRQLIAQGENAPVEFKSTLRRNLRNPETGKDDPIIQLAVLKTIAAFLNTEGGILLIGVSDDKTILGLGADQFQSSDKAMLHLTSLIRDRIGSSHVTYVTMRVEDMGDGLDVMRVECKRASMPAYVRMDKGQSFYVRTGPSTEELPLSEVHTYIKTRFEGAR